MLCVLSLKKLSSYKLIYLRAESMLFSAVLPPYLLFLQITPERLQGPEGRKLRAGSPSWVSGPSSCVLKARPECTVQTLGCWGWVWRMDLVLPAEPLLSLCPALPVGSTREWESGARAGGLNPGPLLGEATCPSSFISPLKILCFFLLKVTWVVSAHVCAVPSKGELDHRVSLVQNLGPGR